MADERLRTKLELKKFVATNLQRKGLTDDMMSILIDVLWRDPYTMRTSGFFEQGGTDTVIVFTDATRIFSIEPYDPSITGFKPRFGFFSWATRAVYHRKFEKEEIELPNEEGFFAIYYGINTTTRVQELYYIKNPTDAEIDKLYTKQVLISFIYWDAVNQTSIAFGDDRHGSQWNPSHHLYQNTAFHAQRHSGINVAGLLINEDGSLDSHAKFTVTLGKMWHDDFLLDIPVVAANATIPVLYFSTANIPRFTETTGFGIYKSTSRITFNQNSSAIAEVASGNFVAYHIFATNEHVATAKKVISVMGQAEYTKLAEVYTAIPAELDTIYQYSPYKGMCHLGTIILEVNDAYTNSVKARIVGFSNEEHPPVTIAEDSKDYLEIDENQELRFKGDSTITINQISHGFTVGNAIRHNATIFVKAQANNAENAQTCGIVTKVIDADNFQYKSDGFIIDAAFIAGKEYFLSPATAGLVMELPVPEVWAVGEVRQSLGFGTPQGLKIEIDVGDEIGESTVTFNEVESLVIAGGNLTLTQSAGANVLTPFPYYTETQLQTSGQSAVHWDNLTNVPSFDNYAGWWFRSYDSSSNSIYSNYVVKNGTVYFREGAGITFSNANGLKISHANTSSQATSSNSGNTIIQSVALDNFGHVTAISTKTITEYNGWFVYADNGSAQVNDLKAVDFKGGTDVETVFTDSGNGNSKLTFNYTGTPGVTDHGALTGLADDDHSQYHNDTRGDVRYYTKTQLQTSAQSQVHWDNITNKISIDTQYSLTGGGSISTNKTINLVGDVATPGNSKYYGTDASGIRGFFDLPSGGGVTDHGALTGLADDDHSQYHNDTRGDVRYYTKTNLQTSGQGAVHWENLTNVVSVNTQHSLTGGGDLSTTRTLNLVGDATSPGDGKYYGTDSSGIKGYHTLPETGGSGGLSGIKGSCINGGYIAINTGYSVSSSRQSTIGLIRVVVTKADGTINGIYSGYCAAVYNGGSLRVEGNTLHNSLTGYAITFVLTGSYPSIKFTSSTGETQTFTYVREDVSSYT